MLFSIIVPIYKVEQYLQRCIDSVLAQSFADYELILVDDGSPDNCPAICDEYARRDARIQVIHKENGGLVSARQAGIRKASGEYVFNLDGDDALCADALENAARILRETPVDILSFSYRHSVNGIIGDVIEDCLEEGLYTKAEIEEIIFPHLLSDENMNHVFYFLCGKVIRRELLIRHQLNVSRSISLGEDICCTIPCFLEAETVFMSKKDVYLYTIRSDSLSNDFKTVQIQQIANVITELRSLPMKKPADFDEQISRYSFFMCFAILASAAEGNHFNAIPELKERILTSLHKDEIQKAHFQKVSPKTHISVFLMKRQWIRLTFYFLYLCKELKRIRKGASS